MSFKKVDKATLDHLDQIGIEKFGNEYKQAKDTINYKKQLAVVIKNARENQGITQKELANMINRKYQKISEYERSVKVPSVVNLLEIAKALHCKLIIDPENSETPFKMECI